MFLAKKWGILIKKESENLIFTGLKIPRDYITDMEDMNKLLYQLEKLYDYILEYVKNHDDFPFGLFITQIRRLFIPKIKVGYSCGLGEIIYSIDIKGNIYPCHRHSGNKESLLGNIFEPMKIKTYEAEFDQRSCSDCWNRYTCSHGCHYEDIQQNQGKRKNIYTCMYAKKMTELSIALCMKLDKNKILQIISRK